MIKVVRSNQMLIHVEVGTDRNSNGITVRDKKR